MIAPTETVIHVRNRHFPSCGSPPAIEAGSSSYVSYFEGPYGDQWVVEIDRKAGTGILRGGDIGWDEPVTLHDDNLEGGLILGDEEFRWLAACWKAATGRELQLPGWQQVEAALRQLIPPQG